MRDRPTNSIVGRSDRQTIAGFEASQRRRKLGLGQQRPRSVWRSAYGNGEAPLTSLRAREWLSRSFWRPRHPGSQDSSHLGRAPRGHAVERGRAFRSSPTPRAYFISNLMFQLELCSAQQMGLAPGSRKASMVMPRHTPVIGGAFRLPRRGSRAAQGLGSSRSRCDES